jgi:fatty-acyl-CoA synthase
MTSQSVQEVVAHPSTRWRSVSELLDTHAAGNPSAPAVSFPSGHLSYGELVAESVLAARRLRARGVGPGDRVAILLREGCVPYVTFGLGTMRLGAMCVPINARNKTRELSYVMQHSQPRVIVSSSEFEGLIREAGLPERCELMLLGGDGELCGRPDQAPPEEVAEIERGVGPDTHALLLYTSGTTANPKGVVHTHATLIAVGYNTSERLRLGSEDRYWTALAMFHVGGWQVLASALAVGACFSHVGFYDAGSTLDQLERERVTVAMPAFELIWTGVLDHPRFPEADLSALRLVMNVGVPERLERMQQRLPRAVQVSMVGMTESAGSICIGALTDSLYSRTHTSGRPLRGMDVRVTDPVTGAECPRGTPGELLFRGVTRFVEYYRDPATTAAVIDEDGWAHTGDLVRQEQDDTVAFMSRLKDMLKVGGENVSAAEIEGYLITHPGVAMASVVAAPDARYGEVPAAFVQKPPGFEVTEDELIEYCTGNIATYKVPRYVRFVEEYPVTASAKIQKFVLRERIEAELRERGITEAPKLVSQR